MNINPTRNTVLAHNMSKGERRIGSIIVRDDDGQTRGIRPRWAQVYAVGEEITSVEPGDWILIEHGRWSRTFELTEPGASKPFHFWAIDPDAIILKTKDKPIDEILGDE